MGSRLLNYRNAFLQEAPGIVCAKLVMDLCCHLVHPVYLCVITRPLHDFSVRPHVSHALSYMDDNTTKNEACFAAVAIAEKLVPRNRAAITEAMQKVLKTTSINSIKKRARQVLQKTRQ